MIRKENKKVLKIKESDKKLHFKSKKGNNENLEFENKKSGKYKNKSFVINKDSIKNLNLKKKEKKTFEEVFNSENITDSLRYLYDECLKYENIPELCDEYLKKYKTKEKACKAMLMEYTLKCSSLQAENKINDIEDIVYIFNSKKVNKSKGKKNNSETDYISEIQMKMVICAAYIGGYDLNTEYIKNAVCFCLCGVKIGDILREFGINSKNLMLFTFTPRNKDIFKKFNNICGKKLNTNDFKNKLNPILSKLETNNKLKFIVKITPLIVFAIVCCIDFGDTRSIANNAYNWFIEEDLNKSKDKKIDIFKDEFEEVERLKR